MINMQVLSKKMKRINGKLRVEKIVSFPNGLKVRRIYTLRGVHIDSIEVIEK